MLERDVAPGIHRIQDAFTNWYLVEEDGRLTVVDAGVPTSWRSLHRALDALGRVAADVAAVVLTHAHFDHIGFAERARRELGVPVWVHEADEPLTKRPRSYGRERHQAWYLATQLQALPTAAAMTLARGWWPTPIAAVETFGDDGTLDVPGSPRIVFTPGHTNGHCALHFPDRDAVIAGDAVVMLDPYSARRGPKVVERTATADVARAVASLDALAATGATTVLTGHGPAWRGGAEAAAERARRTRVA